MARQTIDIDPRVWGEIRATALREGVTASKLVERTMVERLRVRLPDLDDQGAPKPSKPRTPAHTMSDAALANWAVSKEARASVALDHDEKEGTQSLPPDHVVEGPPPVITVWGKEGEVTDPQRLAEAGVPPNRRAAGLPAVTSTSEPVTRAVGRTSASTIVPRSSVPVERSFGSSRPAPKPGKAK